MEFVRSCVLRRQGREAFLKNRAEAIAKMVKQGLTVVLVDLPGTGETRVGENRGRTSYATSVSATAKMLGTSMLELRPLLAGLNFSDICNRLSRAKR